MITVQSTSVDVSDIDYELHMRRALALAQNELTTTPNPRVGCVIVNDDNEVVGEGWHQAPGAAHAEVNALTKAGTRSKGAIAFVTLEPCSHFGKTPPCADALIAADLKTVVIAMLDPYEKVAGSGVERLEQAGIDVILLEDFSQKAAAINRGYIKRMTTGLPYVRCKLAMSLDGRTAAADRQSKWITGAAARSEVQRLRAQSCAIITGVNTVLQDDPSLNVRLGELDLNETEVAHNQFALNRQPIRVILDSALRTPAAANILKQPGETKIITAGELANSSADYPENTEVISTAGLGSGGSTKGRVDLTSVLELLAGNFMVNEVLLEAGPTLSGAFVQASLVDELIIYIGGKFLGSNGLPLLELPGLASMSDQIELAMQDVKQLGNDCRVIVHFN